jgi:hypothetical protein
MNIAESSIGEALRLEDIESLFQHGAPDCEYSPEARGIAEALASLGEEEITQERLAEVIRTVWARSFGPFSQEELEMRMAAFRQVAHRILSQDT